VAPDAAMFFLVHMIVMMALCPCQEHYLLCYCSQGLSITRTVLFVVFASVMRVRLVANCHHHYCNHILQLTVAQLWCHLCLG
jgi:hypothetical protein